MRKIFASVLIGSAIFATAAMAADDYVVMPKSSRHFTPGAGGFAIYGVLRWAKVRNLAVAILVAASSALLLFYVSWVMWETELARQAGAASAATPWRLFQRPDSVWRIAVRAGTPEAVVRRLHKEIATLLTESQQVRANIESSGSKVVANTPEQFGDYVRGEIVKWRRVVATAAIKID